MSKPAPPYSRALLPTLREIRILAGTASWPQAAPPRTTCVLPPDSEPDTLDWACARSRTVLVLVRGKLPMKRERALARALLSAGARGVLVLDDSATFLATCPDDALFHLENPSTHRVYAR